MDRNNGVPSETSYARAEAHLAQICAEYSQTAQRVRGALVGSLATVEREFARSGHYLYEFLQNADDAGSCSMAVRLGSNAVEILNDGRPFSPEDVDSICSIGQSPKKPEGYIGYLGVGFKSVFLVSERPEIHSGPYHFAFGRDFWHDTLPQAAQAVQSAQTVETAPWQIMPHTLPPDTPPAPWSTRFLLPLRDPKIAVTLRDEIGPERLNRRVLLFLRNLARLELSDADSKLTRVVEKRQIGEVVLRNEAGVTERFFQLSEQTQDGLTEEKWLVIARCCRVPSEVRNDPPTQAWNRSEVETREVMLAFKIADDGQLEPVVGTAHMGVFSFLPLREERTGLRFVIQADFLTSHGRETLLRDSLWNQWMCREVLDLIKAETRFLLSDPARRAQTLELLWPEHQDNDSFFAVHLKRGLANFLQKHVLLPAYDGNWVKPDDALYVEPGDLSVRPLMPDSDLERLYGRKPLARNLVVPYSLQMMRVGHLIERTNPFLASVEGNRYLAEKANRGDAAFFKDLLELLRTHCSYQKKTIDRYLGAASFVLTDNNDLRSYHGVYFRAVGRDDLLPPGIFPYVHPLLESGPAREFLEFLGVHEPPKSQIDEELRKRLLPALESEWSATPVEQRPGMLVRLKAMWGRGAVQATGMKGFVTLPARSGRWLAPDLLLFPSEFHPEVDVESLFAAGLLHVVDGEQPPEYVNPDLVTDRSELTSWLRFLSELGVGSRVARDENNWIERLGITAALLYEKAAGRDVDPGKGLGTVPESERGQGYDLSSLEPDGSKRFVEVKGSKSEGPFRIRSSTLRKAVYGHDRDRFYLYLVSHAMSNPQLHVVHARSLDADRLAAVADAVINLKDLSIVEKVPVKALLPRSASQ